MKICNKCGENKDEHSQFYKDFRKINTYKPMCKLCYNLIIKEYRRVHSESVKSRRQLYYINNQEKLSVYRKIRYQRNKSQELLNSKKWMEKNKDKFKIYQRKYMKQRRKTDISFRIQSNLRTRIWNALKYNRKSNSTTNLLGCSIENFRLHIQSKFQDGMTWENYGEWHIDHILPCASFDLSDFEQQKVCFHHTNLQPLWAEENIKKSDNII
jgi:hypothetical protein